MTRHLVTVAAAAALALPCAAGAEGWSVTADPASTRVAWTLDATLHDVEGTARLLEGRLVWDSGSGAAEGEFVIDATSLESGNEKRDRDMHRKVLESADFPRIILRAEAVRGRLPAAGPFELELAGVVEIHGAGHPVSLPITGVRDGSSVTADARFEVPYVELGMKDPSKLFLRVAKVVNVRVELTAELAVVDPE